MAQLSLPLPFSEHERSNLAQKYFASIQKHGSHSEASEKTVSAERKKAQQEIDSSIVKALKADAVRRHIASADTNGLHLFLSPIV